MIASAALQPLANVRMSGLIVNSCGITRRGQQVPVPHWRAPTPLRSSLWMQLQEGEPQQRSSQSNPECGSLAAIQVPPATLTGREREERASQVGWNSCHKAGLDPASDQLCNMGLQGSGSCRPLDRSCPRGAEELVVMDCGFMGTY